MLSFTLRCLSSHVQPSKVLFRLQHQHSWDQLFISGNPPLCFPLYTTVPHWFPKRIKHVVHARCLARLWHSESCSVYSLMSFQQSIAIKARDWVFFFSVPLEPGIWLRITCVQRFMFFFSGKKINSMKVLNPNIVFFTHVPSPLLILLADLIPSMLTRFFCLQHLLTASPPTLCLPNSCWGLYQPLPQNPLLWSYPWRFLPQKKRSISNSTLLVGLRGGSGWAECID